MRIYQGGDLLGFIWALDGLTNGLNSFDRLYKGFYEVLRGFLGPEHALKHPEL